MHLLLLVTLQSFGQRFNFDGIEHLVLSNRKILKRYQDVTYRAILHLH